MPPPGQVFGGSHMPRWAAEGQLLLAGVWWSPPCPTGGSICAWPWLSAPLHARAFGGSLGLLLRPGTLCPSQMSYELWRDLEEESDSEGQGRKPEIGHVFLMDRGGLRRGQRPEGSCLGSRSPRGAGKACVGWLEDCEGRLAPSLLADTDYVTALCSQVVYEGLVDDTFRIKCGRQQGSTGLCTHNRAEWGSAHTWPASVGFVPGIVGHSAVPTGTVPMWGAAGGHPQGQSSL